MTFSQIFQGNQHHRGITANGKIPHYLEKNKPFNHEEHTKGIKSQGLSPLRQKTNEEEAYCIYGGLDFDFEKIPPAIEFCKFIYNISPELFVFESKSSGYHIYWFANDWIKAAKMKAAMERLKKKINPKYKADRVIPYETKLKDIEAQCGFWFNVPYFANTRRCLNHLGEPLELEQFELKYKLRKHHYLAAIIGWKAAKKGTGVMGRHPVLFRAALYQKYKMPGQEQILDEINNSFKPPITNERELEHAKDTEKYNEEHLENNLNNYFQEIGIEEKIPEPPSNLFERTAEYEDFAFNTGPGATVQESGTGKEPEPFKVHWIGEEQYKLKNREWLMKGYLKAGNITLLQAPPGSLKTIVGQQMVYCGASGKPFMGHEITETGNGLIICPEEDRNELELRLEGIKQHYGTITNGNRIAIRGIEHVTHLVRFEKGKIYTGKDYESIKKFIKDNNIKYIHMDPLVSFQTGDFDENSNPQMDKYIKEVLIPLARINNGCLIMVHHSRKPQFQKASKSRSINPWESMNESRGASSLPAAARIVITLMPMTEDLWNALYKKLIPENQIYRHVAIIDAKNNYAATNQYPFWCMKQLQEVRTCEGVIVEIPVLQQSSLTELQNAKSVMHEEHLRKSCSEYIPIIERYFPNKKVAVQEVSLHSIAKEIVGKNPNISISKTGEIKKIIDLMKQGFHRAHKVNDIEYIYYYDRWDKVNHKMQRTDTSIKVSLNL